MLSKASLSIIAALSLAGPLSAAELIDPAAFGFGRPGYMVDTTVIGGQDFDGSIRGSLEVFELRTILPVWSTKVGEGGRIATSLGYNITQLNFDPGDRMDLHNLELQVSYFWNSPTSNWWGLGFVTPGLGTDFNGISFDDFQISALGLLGYKFTETFTIAGGVFASYANDDGTLLPALGFIWNPGNWTLQVTPPFMVLGYKISDPVTVSLSMYPSGGSWDVDRQDGINTVDLSGWQGAASIIWKATDKLSLSLRAGINFAGEFELRDTRERVLVDENLDPAPFGAFNIRWAF
ncbi:DUF6268 family outer membrane beta-barrel protein [Prosthecobacter sp. SYSU 5D2]|uniref:DUF6268 family outer membrane beta-barrel protein n=1 Tax=Prosthecobacter sp. SYSU 5D2 TaxID=3134134 RepID=UPI0031FF3899